MIATVRPVQMPREKERAVARAGSKDASQADPGRGDVREIVRQVIHSGRLGSEKSRHQKIVPATRGKSEEATDRNTAGFPLGVADGIPYEAVSVQLEPGDCINGIELSPNDTGALLRRQLIDEIDFRGSLSALDWTISLSEKHSEDPLETLLRGGSTQTFPICDDFKPPGKTLTLGGARFPFP